MQFIASRFKISLVLAARSSPSTAFLVILIANNKIPINTGKLSTAMRMLLLLAFAAMPEIKLSEDENPNEVRSNVNKNSDVSATGF